MPPTIEAIVKKRVKNADRKAKKRELERNCQTIEEYIIKKEKRIALQCLTKSLRKYQQTVEQTWKTKSNEEYQRLERLKKHKLPMDCVNIIIEFINPNMMYLLFKMTAQMKQMLLTIHYTNCITVLENVDNTRLFDNLLHDKGSLVFLEKYSRAYMLSHYPINNPLHRIPMHLYIILNEYRCRIKGKVIPTLYFSKFSDMYYWLITPGAEHVYISKVLREDGSIIIKREIFDHLHKTIAGLTQYSASNEFHDYLKILNGIMNLQSKKLIK